MLMLVNSAFAFELFGYKFFENNKFITKIEPTTTQLPYDESGNLIVSSGGVSYRKKTTNEKPTVVSSSQSVATSLVTTPRPATNVGDTSIKQYFSTTEIENFRKSLFAQCLSENNVGKIKLYISDLDEYYNIVLNNNVNKKEYKIITTSTQLNNFMNCKDNLCVLENANKLDMPLFTKLSMANKFNKCR